MLCARWATNCSSIFVTFFPATRNTLTVPLSLATIALAARFDSLAAVVTGTTTGMLIADVPAVLLAEKALLRISVKAVRYVAATLFAVMGATLIAGLRIF